LGQQREVLDYCANDVAILQALFFKFINDGLIDPNNGDRLVPSDGLVQIG
jgi:hypothetical protein